MQGTIEAISSTKKGFRIVGQPKGEWFNKGKMLDEDLICTLNKGDAVEFNAPDGKWVTKLSKLGDDVVVEPMAAAKEVFKPKLATAEEYMANPAKKSDAQSRGCAVNAVMGSSYIVELLAGDCHEETVANVKGFIERTAEFVYGGKWNV